MEIRLLTEETISRISAGEVIERPLNVVKELVENSIDAGSTAVTIEIRDGGISMIRVTDNGCGIEKDQIARAFIRHATSKIRDAEDLSRLSSLGFRGEALASIAAVAQVEMITKVRDSVLGTRAVNDHLAAYSPDAPVKIDLEEIGAPDGTTVIVRSLFGTIPVRRRFLRQPQTEAGYITDLVEKQALSHPFVSFHYRVNGQEKLHTTGNGDLRELIYRIYGRETAAAIIPVHAKDPEHGLRLDGFLGRPEISRSSRSFETFFINGRMLRSRELSAGLEEGYRTDLMQHRFPFAVLHISMPPEDVDVNVHPSKMEVRFTDRKAVMTFLDRSVHEALHSVELIPRANLNTAREERAAQKKEMQQKAARLQAEPRPEAFESARISQRPTPPAVSEPAIQKAFEGGAAAQSPAAPAMSGPAIQKAFEDGAAAQRPAAPAISGSEPVTQKVYENGAAVQKPLSPGQSVTTPPDTRDPGRSAGLPALAPSDAKNPVQKTFTENSTTKSDSGFTIEIPESKKSENFPSSTAPDSQEKADSAPSPSLPDSREKADSTPYPSLSDSREDSFFVDKRPKEKSGSSDRISGQESAQLTLNDLVQDGAFFREKSAFSGEEPVLTRKNAELFRFVGQVFGTYWLIEVEKRLLIIDQHAAHEKVNYERMMRRIERDHPGLDNEGKVRDALADEYLALDRIFKAGLTPDGSEENGKEPVLVASQRLMPPIVLRLSGREETAYQQFSDVFAAMGYEIEDFGGGAYAIRSVPTELFGQSADALFREIIEEIISERVSGTPRAVISKVASMSCKAAVKGNSRLSEPEARALIRELLTLENPFHCPHGRPTMIIMSQYEMDRKFRRIV